MSILRMAADTTEAVPLILSEGGVAYVLAIHELVDQYDFETDVLAGICEAAGGPENALELLGDGIPAEFILSMGEAR